MGDGTRIERDCVLREGEVRRSNCWWGDVTDGRSRLTSRNGGGRYLRISIASGIVEVVVRRAGRSEVVGYIRGNDDCNDVESRKARVSEGTER